MTIKINELTEGQKSAALYFSELFHKALQGHGRHIIGNIRMHHDKFEISLKDHKNAIRSFKFERAYAFKMHLQILIEELSDLKVLDKLKDGKYNFKDVLFNATFTGPEHLELFGHRFQLTITPQKNGEILPFGISLLHTEKEWAVYEKQCQDQVDNATDAIFSGSPLTSQPN